MEDSTFRERFAASGRSWPPDLEGAETSAEFWGLPAGSFVNLRGIGRRPLLLAMCRLLLEGHTSTLTPGSCLLTFAERSLRFSQPPIDVCPTTVPSEVCIVLHRSSASRWRLSFLSPVEVFALQGMRLDTFLARQFSYTELVRIAEAAFHLQSAAAFVIAALAVRPPHLASGR